jgi:hypothetical protein
VEYDRVAVAAALPPAHAALRRPALNGARFHSEGRSPGPMDNPHHLLPVALKGRDLGGVRRRKPVSRGPEIHPHFPSSSPYPHQKTAMTRESAARVPLSLASFGINAAFEASYKQAALLVCPAGAGAMWYDVLADFVVVVHLAYVSFVVLGQLLIMAGAALRWSWIRNLPFRLAHLAAIVIVALESVCNIDCPLTIWEGKLRLLAGHASSDESFVARGVHAIMFYRLDKWVFTTIYVCFAVAVVLTLWFVPPRRARMKHSP